jgi:HlyD family secretion protein
MNAMRKRLLAIVAVLLIVCGAAWLFDLPARFGWTHRQDGVLTLYGNVDIRQVQLGFRVSGRIAATLVDEGDAVKASDVLARLDTRPYEDSVRAAQAQVANARATLDKLVAGPRAAEIDQARAAHDEQVANVKNANQAFERSRVLRPAGAISQASLDEATAAKDMAMAREASAGQALRLLEEGTRAEDIEAGRASLQGAEANLATAETSLSDAELRAPDDGIILSRVREPGAITAPSDIVYVLSLTKPVWVRAYIAEPSLGAIHPGMIVAVTSDTAPTHPFRGRIGFISPVAEFTPKSVETPELRTDLVYRLRIVIDDADASLRQGMPVTVRIELGTTAPQAEPGAAHGS